MAQWWEALTLDLHIFYAIGIVSTVVLLIQLLMTVIGVDHDTALEGGGDIDGIDLQAGDVGGPVEHASGLHVVSTRTIVAFLAGFGWTGAIARTGGLSIPVAVLVALAVGVMLMLLVYWLMRALYSLRQSGNLDFGNAIGEVGTVYVRVPAAGKGAGQVQVVVQGRLVTAAAVTEDHEPITSGRRIKVTGLLGGNLLKVEAI